MKLSLEYYLQVHVSMCSFQVSYIIQVTALYDFVVVLMGQCVLGS